LVCREFFYPNLGAPDWILYSSDLDDS